MSENTTGNSPNEPRTIIIDRRSGRSWIWRLLGTLLTLLIGVSILGVLTGNTMLPSRVREQHEAGPLMGPKVAIVPVSGAIQDRSASETVRQLRQARADDLVRAVVLRVDSPGGTLTGSDQIWREIRSLQAANKPVVASFGGIAASGGYYIATACDTIFAEPTTMTGSIGVIMELPQLGGLLEKIGVEMETLTTGPWKDSPSLFRPMSSSERDRWLGMVHHGLDRFVAVIAKGRRLSVDDVRKLADGRVFSAEEALQAKLVDRLGYLDDAILEAEKRASLPEARVIRYGESRGLLETLFMGSSASSGSPWRAVEAWLTGGPQMMAVAR